MMRRLCLWFGVWSLTVAAASAQDPALKSLFNGKDLSGWTVPADNQWWTVADGVCSARSDPAQTGSILWTEQDYQDFIVQLDFRMGVGTVDSGVFLRTESQQIQIGISGSLKRDMTCSPYIPGKGYPVEASGIAELLRADDWNTLRIRARGGDYTVWLNGKEVMTYRSDTAIERGPIGLQLHPQRDMHIDFRRISLAEL